MGLTDVLSCLMAMVASLMSGILLARGGEVTVGVVAVILCSILLLAILRAGRAMAPVGTAAAPPPVPADDGK